MTEVLTDAAVAAALAELPEWTGDATAITRTVTLPGFPAAISVVDLVAETAEEINHHPDIDIRYRSLTFRLRTHSAGGVTEYDLALARRIDEVVRTVTATTAGH